MINKVDREARRPIFPTPAGLVVSIDSNGKPNIISLGEIFNLSIREPVWVGIAVRETRYSWELIKKQGEFTVNLPPASLLKQVKGCGSCSGRDGIDKFARFGLTPQPSRYVKPPIIAECPVNLECKVVGFHHVGDLRGKRIAILGCGPIGLSVLLAARRAGAARIYVSEPIAARPARRELFRISPNIRRAAAPY